MSHDAGSGLLPLRTGFDLAWTGYRRDQVRHYVRHVENDLRILAADRDAALVRAECLVRHLEASRAENRRLTERLDRLCRTPIDLDGAADRLRHMVELAQHDRRELDERAARLLAEREAAAEAHAERVIRDATDQVRILCAHRDRVAAGLRAAREQLARAAEQLGPVPES